MQEETTFNIFYGGISFQHLAIVLISVFTLCYEPGILSRGPSCVLYFSYNFKISGQVSFVPVTLTKIICSRMLFRDQCPIVIGFSED